jgi:aconitate hydratase
VSFVLFPGSQRILEVMAREGLLQELLAAGAVVSESTCGACPGIGHVPAAGAKSLRAFNRNFPGRSGVKDDQVYLCSSVVAAASALTGTITDPRKSGAAPELVLPASFEASAAGFVLPAVPGDEVEAGRRRTAGRRPDTEHGPSAGRGPDAGLAPDIEVVRGPNIKDVPLGEPVPESFSGPVLLKAGDKVSTDEISPSGSAALVFRSNVPAIAEFTFKNLDPEFVSRAKAAGRGIIVAGELYGQGSSREAAAMAPMYLGVRAVLARSFARIHRANLINWGIVPLTIEPSAYDAIAQGDRLTLVDLRAGLLAAGTVTVVNERTGDRYSARSVLTAREREILVAGGVLAHTKRSA